MIHTNTELRFINSTVGYGVVATQLIPKGTITWVMCHLDRSYSEKEIQTLGEAYLPIFKKYCFRDNLGQYILCWDMGRYLNHSFEPNCLTTPYDFEIAIRDIQPGEELTNHYGYLNLDPMELMNDKTGIQEWVKAEDVLSHSSEWDEKICQAFPFIKMNSQVLEAFLSSEQKQKIENILQNPHLLDSISTCYWDQEKPINKR